MRDYVVAGAIVGVILAAQAGALRGDPGKEAESEKVARLGRQLGDGAFVKREAASRELETMGAPALAALRKAAASSDDAEVRRRAERVKDAIAEAAEVAKLQGVWTMASYEVEGKQLPSNDKKLTVTIMGRKWVAEEGRVQVDSGSLTLVNPDKSPLAVDWVHLDGPNKGSMVFAICRVDRDTFSFCCGVRAEDRPTEFATRSGDAGRWLITYNRQKK